MNHWRIILSCLTPLISSVISSSPPLASGPWGSRINVASNEAMIISDCARFTILTDRLIRMEYATSSINPVFEDRATVAFINRDLGVIPSFTQEIHNGILTITTSAIQLNYSIGEPFSSTSLIIQSIDSDSSFDSWSYDQVSTGNLFGTIRTLDHEGQPPLNCTLIQNELQNKCGWDQSDCACEWGLISKEGWSVVDDSLNYALSDDADFWDGANIDAIDLYMFAHGWDYKGAINDYIKVGGNIAMVPRNAMGVWWTRWYDFSQQTALNSVDDFRTRSMPMDVLVLDMNWHLKNDWTGYTFDDRIYPYPSDLFDELHSYGLTTAGNIHDADGVSQFEAQFEQMCATLGLDPATTEVVPYNISDYASQISLEDDVMLPLEDTGFDFWWIDWQQGESGYGAEGGKMNPTIWTSHMRSTDKQRRGGDERAMVLSRWGGLGGHRYQVGFSGDVEVRWNYKNWQDLAFQPYFSATASNVGYGYWSHDIVGPPLDMELYVRWLQWGSFSSVMRNHDRGMSAGQLCSDTNPSTCALVQPWLAGSDYFVPMRDAMRARAALLPYLYTALRQSFDTGVGLMRPLYYEFPEEFMSYLQSRSMPQYFLGDDLVISPIVTPADPDTKLAAQPLWVPPGNWVERTTGLLRTGVSSIIDDKMNKNSKKRKTIFEIEDTTCPTPSPNTQLFDCAPNSFYNQEQCEARGCCWNDDIMHDGTVKDLRMPTCFYSDEMISQLVIKSADLGETPMLVRSGAILVEFPDSVNGGGVSSQMNNNELIGRASRQYESLSLSVFLSGAVGGSTMFYEDDGHSIAYLNDSYLTTSISWSLSPTREDADDDNDSLFTLEVAASEGNGYSEMLSNRDYEIRLVNSPPPTEVNLEYMKKKNSPKIKKNLKPKHSYLNKKWKNQIKHADDSSWYYDGATSTLIIVLSQQSTTQSFSISCQLSQPSVDHEKHFLKTISNANNKLKKSSLSSQDLLLSGVRGVLRRAVLAKECLNEARLCPGESTGQQNEGFLQVLASSSSSITHAAMNDDFDGFWTIVSNVPNALSSAIDELQSMNVTELGIGSWRVTQAISYLQASAEEIQL